MNSAHDMRLFSSLAVSMFTLVMVYALRLMPPTTNHDLLRSFPVQSVDLKRIMNDTSVNNDICSVNNL